MIRVITTNISYDDNECFCDHQSRVIGVYNWNDFVNEIKEGKSVHRTDIFHAMIGNTLPKHCTVHNVVYDEFHLQADIFNGYFNSKLLAYIIQDQEYQSNH